MRKIVTLIAFGFAGLLLSACKPQNAVPPAVLTVDPSLEGGHTAIALQVNGTRHAAFVDIVSGTGNGTLYVRRNEGSPIAVRTSTDIRNVDIAALPDGGSYLAWMECVGVVCSYRNMAVTAGGALSSVLPLTTNIGGTQPTTLAFDELGPDTPQVAAGADGSVYVLIRTGDETRSHLFVRRVVTPSLQAGWVDSGEGRGYLWRQMGAKLKVDRFGNAHIAYSRVTAAGVSGFRRDVRYSIFDGVTFPVPIREEVFYGATDPTSRPGLAVDDTDATVRAYVGFAHEGDTGTVLNMTRYDNGTFNSTRVFTTTGFAPTPREFPFTRYDSMVEATMGYPRIPFMAYGAVELAATPVTTDVFLWNPSSGQAPERISDVGNVTHLRMGSVTTSNLDFALVAYAATTGTAPGVYVYDVVNASNVRVFSGRQCSTGNACRTDAFDFAARGDSAAGTFTGKQAGAPQYRALVSRNNQVPSSRLIVNTDQDNSSIDSFISLREAMLIANGSLTTGFSAAEKTQLLDAGCLINDGGTIIGGCGRGISDTIAISLPNPAIINITSLLPAINDGAGTRIQGTNFNGARYTPRATVNFPIALSHGFLITSNRNTIFNLDVIGARDGISITGSQNELSSLNVLSSSINSLAISGSNNLVGGYYGNRARIGECQARTTSAITLQGAATGNRLQNFSAGCANGFGVWFNGAQVMSNTINSGRVGGSFDSDPAYTVRWPNSNAGIKITNASYNVIEDSTIYYNGDAGVILGGGTHHNVILSSMILTNAAAGVHAQGVHGVQLSDVRITGNANAGVQIDGSSPGFVSISGGEIFSNAHGVRANGAYSVYIGGANIHHNFGDGVLLDESKNVYVSSEVTHNGGAGVRLTGAGTTQNFIGEAVILSNTIGIREENGATGNIWGLMHVYGNTGLGIDKGAAGVTAPPISVTGYTAGTRQLGISVTGGASVLYVYSARPDPTGYGEGFLLGTATASGDNFVYTLPAGENCVTMVAEQSSGSTEFSQNYCAPAAPARKPVFLPAVTR